MPVFFAAGIPVEPSDQRSFGMCVRIRFHRISYDVSTESTVTINGELVSLWEHNLLAVRAEAEYGFLVNDVDAFVTYINAA